MRTYRRPSRFGRAAGTIAAVVAVLLGVDLYLSHQTIYEKYVPKLLGTPSYLPVRCWFENPGTRDIDCGYLHVLEDRQNPDGTIIRLPIVIVRALEATQAPVLFLDGGPGASPFITERVSGVLPNHRAESAPWSANRDLIFTDIRGVGLSRPSLRCSRVRRSTSWQFGYERWIRSVRVCADKLVQQGIQLAHYNSQEVVRDLAELQDELGVEQWILFGESYATRPAMMFMRDYPDRVEAAVFEGTFPPWVGRGERMYRHMDRVVDTIEKACEADTNCARKYPNIKTALLSAMKAARDDPPTLKVHSSVPMRSAMAYARIDDAEILRWFAFHLSRRGGIKTTPKLIKALSEGHYPSLSYVIANWPLYEEPYFTQGAHWSVWCNDAPELQVEILQDQARSLLYMADIIQRKIDHDICDVWPRTSDFALSTRPSDYATEVPTLILTGDFDIPTPKEWAEEAERVLPRSVLFNVPGAGHGYTVYSYVQRAIDAFLKDTGRAPDVLCTENENRLVFH